MSLNIELKRRAAEVMKKMRDAISGKALSYALSISESAVSQETKTGHGAVAQVLLMIGEARLAIGATCTQRESEEAIRSLIELICSVAGYHPYKPMELRGDPSDAFTAAQRILSDSGNVIKEINQSLDPKSENGANISSSEAKKIERALDDAIQGLLAAREFVKRVEN